MTAGGSGVRVAYRGESVQHALGVDLTPVAWSPTQPLDERRWIEWGVRIGRAGKATNWWLGDWLRFGNARYGEKYRLAAKLTLLDEQTLANLVHVATRVDPRCRRADLSWSHHAEVAKFEADAQVRWLARAVDDRMSVRDLRREVRRGSRLASPPRGAVDRYPEPDQAAVCPECGQAIRPGRLEALARHSR